MNAERGSASGVREGEVLAGKFRIEKVLGEGGMGVVVAAYHLQLEERVALKFLLPNALASDDAVARFLREARAAVKIKSEHVARVSDVGTLDNGAPYLVMEHLTGSDLSAWLRDKGPLSVERAADFVLQACEAIAEAHSLGIVHRDLKPSNLFVIRRGDGTLCVKVLDFGISKTTGMGISGADLTHSTTIMGSPQYMSPEQMKASRDVDPRSDVWALGVILHELLTGAPPFTGETMPELVLRIAQAAPTPLRKHRPDLPTELEVIVLRCLEKDRTRRYQGVGELARALVRFGPPRAQASLERILGILRVNGETRLANAPSSSEPSPEAGTQASWADGPVLPSRGWPLAAGLATALAVGAWLVLRGQSEHLGSDAAASSAAMGEARVVSPPPVAAAPVSPPSRTAPPASTPFAPAAPIQGAPAPTEPVVHPVATEPVRGSSSPKQPKPTRVASRDVAHLAPAPLNTPARPRPTSAPAQKKPNLSSLINDRR